MTDHYIKDGLPSPEVPKTEKPNDLEKRVADLEKRMHNVEITFAASFHNLLKNQSANIRKNMQELLSMFGSCSSSLGAFKDQNFRMSDEMREKVNKKKEKIEKQREAANEPANT